VDIAANKVIVIEKDKNVKNTEARRFLVFDIESHKMIGLSLVTDKHLIGRFCSKLFTIDNGHVYFKNEVYKIRYDVMLRTESDLVD
jgi:hypothetical protein